MNAVRNKLKSRRGASIIIALLVLLICITAGAAALTAASANAGRYTHMRKDQQRYLAVSSAVKLVRRELCGQEFTATATMEESQLPTGETEFKLELTDPKYEGTFGPWLKDALYERFRATGIPEEWGGGGTAAEVTYSGLGLEVDSHDVLDESLEKFLGQVQWKLTLEDNYDLTAQFWLEDEGTKYYPTTLTIPGQVEETRSEPERIGAGQRWRTTAAVTVRWDEGDAVITQS